MEERIEKLEKEVEALGNAVFTLLKLQSDLIDHIQKVMTK